MIAKERVLHFAEPTLSFRHRQAVEDPRDGLSLFGPLDSGNIFGLRVGAIGTQRGIDYFTDWLRRIQGPLHDHSSAVARPYFPGFEAAFRIPWKPHALTNIVIPESEILAAVHVDDRHQRVHGTVSVYADRLLEASLNEEDTPDLWFVIEPDVVLEYCRPQSNVPVAIQVKAASRLNPRMGRRLKAQPALFDSWNETAEAYGYDTDFHNQLKARLLGRQIVTQVVRESTLTPVTGIPDTERPRNDTRPFQAAIAWNLSTTAFYKAGGRPWKLEGIRDGVFYLGMVFKRDETKSDPKLACCATQMFLDSGDGVVFRGAVGPWYAPDNKEFHLDRNEARALAAMAIESYKKKSGGKAPAEMFIHGRTSFSDEEWRGFTDAIDTSSTRLVGIKIRDDVDLRLYRLGSHPVLRGTAYVRHMRAAYLWTRGFSARERTYIGREVPKPLRVEIDRGDAKIETVLADIMALTKLNYNTCMLADGLPVTLRFANAVGEILTAGAEVPAAPLPFKHYI